MAAIRLATAALTLGKASAAEKLPAAGIAVCVVLAVLAASFAWLVLRMTPSLTHR